MSAITLETLGWDDRWAAAFAAVGATDEVPGRVVLEHNHVFRVLAADAEHLAEVSGRVKHRAEARHELPAVGDWVRLRPDARGGRGQIRGVLPRRTRFSRKAAGRETEEQIIAANIDVVFLVFGMDHPVNPNAIERYLVVARYSGAEPIIVLNKRDLVDDLADRVAIAAAAAGDAPVLAVSGRTGEGLDQLRARLASGRTVALLGPSGVGKSSIVNQLVGAERLPTGDVRDWDARGRHTSVHRQLVVRAEGGLVIDTPGMRELQLWETDAVRETFTDIQAVAVHCHFRDCRHETEPDCAVKAAAETGALDPERVESYRKLQLEQEAIEEKREARAQLEQKRQGRVSARTLRPQPRPPRQK